MDLSKLKTNDYVLFLDGTIARVTRILQTSPDFRRRIYFDREIRGDDDTALNNWFYTRNGLWGHEPGVGNDIIKILESNNESE